MHTIDWAVLIAFVLFTVIYGIWKGRKTHDLRGYMLADKEMPWYAVAFSIMATQASAITFVSTTGQGYADGMRFVQFYFGLPIAMVVLAAVAVPLFHRLNVYTAYEFLEKRFDLKTRVLTGFLFLIQRGLGAGLSLYAPALILSVVLGWDMFWTVRVIGAVVILYTVIGGVKGVNWNDFQQMIVIAGGMFAALLVTIQLLPQHVSFMDAVTIAGESGRLKAVDFSFDWQNRYNFWSGIIGGMFVALAYFGTDQSQVQRYLTGRSITQSRLGLLFNGLAKIPMQFFILFVGAMVFVFYQFHTPPIFFNKSDVGKIRNSVYAQKFHQLESRFEEAAAENRKNVELLIDQPETAKAAVLQSQAQMKSIRSEAVDLLKKNDPSMNPNDVNYVFMTFVTEYLPHGLIGIIIVVIFAATMSTSSSELNSLATASVIDVYQRLIRRNASQRHYLWVSRISTALWGFFAITLSEYASRLGTLVEAVNIIGSLFYGTVLGIFVLAFFFRRLSGTSVFIAAIAAELFVFYLFKFTTISFLWYNVFGCAAVVFVALLLSPVFKKSMNHQSSEEK